MSATAETFERATEPAVGGILHRPAGVVSDGIILTHGAGSNCRAPLLVALSNTFAESGWLVLRCDLPYRQARRTGPPRPGDAVRDREGLSNAVAAMREVVPEKIFLGGHSYGGRQSSMLVADHPGLVSGLLLMSYPLHPPGRPQQLRVQHLPKLTIPTLFVHGTRDPFGSIPEMEAALRLIPAKTRLLPVEEAGHDLGCGNKSKSRLENLPQKILAVFDELMD